MAPDAPAGTPTDQPLAPPLIVARSAAYGLLLALPATLVNGWLATQEPKPQAAQLFTVVLVLVGFGLAGFAAGTNAPKRTQQMGALAGFSCFIPVELVAVLGRLDRGDAVNLGGIIVVGFLAAIFGLIGSKPGAARRAAKQKALEGPS